MSVRNAIRQIRAGDMTKQHTLSSSMPWQPDQQDLVTGGWASSVSPGEAWERIKGIGTSLWNYGEGAYQGGKEVLNQRENLGNIAYIDDWGGITPKEGYTEEDIAPQKELYEKAREAFSKETFEPTAGIIGTVVAPNIVIPAMIGQQAYEGSKVEGTPLRKALNGIRQATYGPFVDMITDPKAQQKFEQNPAGQTANALLALGQMVYPAERAIRFGNKKIAELNRELSEPVQYTQTHENVGTRDPGAQEIKVDFFNNGEGYTTTTSGGPLRQKLNEIRLQNVEPAKFSISDSADYSGIKPEAQSRVESLVKAYNREFPDDPITISDAARPQNAEYGSPTSWHKAGEAVDFVAPGLEASAEQRARFVELAKEHGFNEVLDEYSSPSAYATGGHVHVGGLGEYEPRIAKVQPEVIATELPVTNEPTSFMFDQSGKFQQLSDVTQKVTQSLGDIKSLLSPASASEAARQTARMMRENMSDMARKYDIAEKSMNDARKYFSGVSPQESIGFIDNIETGIPHADPKMRVLANTIRQALDNRVKQVQDLGTGKLEQAIENYFPHIWKDPKQAETFYGAWFGKRPLEGGKSFLKQRTIPTTLEGIKRGLEPVSFNPVDLTLLKLREMDKYIMAHKTLNELKAQGLVKFSRGIKPEPGWVKINDKISTIYGRGENGELIIRGQYWAQPDAARLINNYLSPGLRDKSVAFNGVLAAGNTLNQYQLGMSAFHLGFTSFDAMTSKVALATKQIFGKDAKLAFKSLAESPAAAFTTALKGNKYLKEWYNPGSQGAEIGRVMDALSVGGARARMDTFYQTKIRETAIDSFKKAKREFKEGNLALGVSDVTKAIFKGVLALPEALPRMIMEEVVPRQKLGVASSMMKWEMERRPNMTHAELRKVASEVWDSVDNRLGQLAYDNLFWNKTFKDSLMLSVRSVGWNLGTVRELGGGLVDVTKWGKEVLKMPLDYVREGKTTGPEFTHRMSYVIALPLTVAMYGAVIQYLATGKGPQELKDYFFPKIGGLDKNGNPERVSLPSYMKDVYHVWHKPKETVTNKLHPLWALTAEILNNRDYYNTEIRHEGDPLTQQIFDITKHIGKSTVPFAIQGYQKLAETGAPLSKKILPFVGITPAPRDINQTEAEQLASKIVRGKIPVEQKTREEFKKSELKSRIARDLQQGSTDSLKVAISEGKISKEEAARLTKEKGKSPLMRQLERLDASEALDVYSIATPKERQEIRKIVQQKVANKLPKLNKNEKEVLIKKAAILR